LAIYGVFLLVPHPFFEGMGIASQGSHFWGKKIS
jgi:hypothetical protein